MVVVSADRGPVQDNNLQTSSPQKEPMITFFSINVSDDFKTKKNVKEKKNEKNVFFSKDLVFIAEMPLSANLFRQRTSIQNYAGSRGAPSVGGGGGGEAGGQSPSFHKRKKN